MKRMGRARGYTLIELMVVVAIVGVLAALAVFGYRKYTTWTKSREVEDIIQQIHQGQKKYFLSVDKSGYLSCSDNLTDFYPKKPSSRKMQLRNPTHAGVTCWDVIVGADTNAATYHGFAIVAGIPGEAPPATNLDTAPTWPATTTPWYVIQAASDVDGDGNYTYYVSSSFNPGELLQSKGSE